MPHHNIRRKIEWKEKRIEKQERQICDNEGRIWLCWFSYWKGWPKYTVVRDQVTYTVHWYIGSGRLFREEWRSRGESRALVFLYRVETRGRLTKSHCYLSTKFSLFFSTLLDYMRALFLLTDTVTCMPAFDKALTDQSDIDKSLSRSNDPMIIVMYKKRIRILRIFRINRETVFLHKLHNIFEIHSFSVKRC